LSSLLLKARWRIVISNAARAKSFASVSLPAIVTSDLRLNEPRYASLPNIMKAKKKTLDTTTPADLGVDTSPRVTLLGVERPAERQAGIKVEDVAQLVDKLRNEAKVIS
jgi:electron transfer flavoprotein beta subunit